MAKKGNGGLVFDDVFNETGGGEEPDINGDKLYYTYEEAMAVQLKAGDLQSTPNTRASEGMQGGPASGEENPVPLKSPQ